MENQTEFTEIKKNYASLHTKFQEAENMIYYRMLVREKQLERLESKRKKLANTYPQWTEYLLRPVIEQIKKAFPDCVCDDEILCPMGIGNRVTVSFQKNRNLEKQDKHDKEMPVYICFLPGNLHTGELFYETGETGEDYKPGKIGYINRFNRVTKAVETIQELIDYLNKQITSNGS